MLIAQVLIVLGCIVLFFVTFILNKRTKVNINEEDIEIPEQCLNCSNKSCLDKKIKKENIESCQKGENNNE